MIVWIYLQHILLLASTTHNCLMMQLDVFFFFITQFVTIIVKQKPIIPTMVPTCGLGLVQERTLVSTPPPQEALHGVETVDQGLERWKDLEQKLNKAVQCFLHKRQQINLSFCVHLQCFTFQYWKSLINSSLVPKWCAPSIWYVFQMVLLICLSH